MIKFLLLLSILPGCSSYELEGSNYTLPKLFGELTLSSCSGAPSCGTNLARYRYSAFYTLMLYSFSLCLNHQLAMAVCTQRATVPINVPAKAVAPMELTVLNINVLSLLSVTSELCTELLQFGMPMRLICVVLIHRM